MSAMELQRREVVARLLAEEVKHAPTPEKWREYFHALLAGRNGDEARTVLEFRWRDSPIVRHAVWLDGEIVCTGTAAPTPQGLLLFGGATLPRARGRGAYRALVRARWDDAVSRASPALITQGGSISRPILERLGFEPVGHVHMLVDDFGRASA